MKGKKQCFVNHLSKVWNVKVLYICYIVLESKRNILKVRQASLFQSHTHAYFIHFHIQTQTHTHTHTHAHKHLHAHTFSGKSWITPGTSRLRKSEVSQDEWEIFSSRNRHYNKLFLRVEIEGIRHFRYCMIDV